MKRYTNTSHSMLCVVFTDDSAQFLRRGDKFETDKKTKTVPDGVMVEDCKKPKKSYKKEEVK